MTHQSFFGNLDLRRALMFSAPICAAVIAAQEAGAVVVNVTDMTTLRAAIDTVNANSTADQIVLAAGTYAFTSSTNENSNADGDLDVTKSAGDLVIEGAGAGNTTIDAAGLDRIFHLMGGTNVTIRNLTLVNGYVEDDGAGTFGSAFGGGIFSTGSNVIIEDAVVSSCVASGRGGVLGTTSAAEARGGGIYMPSGGNLTLTRARVINCAALGGNGDSGNTSTTGIGTGASGNSALGGGIFILNASAQVQMTDSTISGNQARGGDGGNGATGGIGGRGGAAGTSLGGGMFFQGLTMNIQRSTFSGNDATGGSGGDGGNGGGGGGDGGDGSNGNAGRGAAIYVSAGVVQLVNSTIAGNLAQGGAGGAGGGGGTGPFPNGGDGANGGPAGGALALFGGTSGSVYNSTIAGNTAAAGAAGALGAAGVTTSGSGRSGADGAGGSGGATSGGGVYVSAGGGYNLTFLSTILADNSGGASPDLDMALGTLTINYSLLESSTVTPGGTGNVTGVDPGLGTLQDNGGLTETREIGATSAAYNTGDNGLTLSTDQRGTGFSREFAGQADMGAYESQAATPAPVVTAPAAAVATSATSYDIDGTAEADALVRVYEDTNNDGDVDIGEPQVGSQQLTLGGTAFSINVNLTANSANDFLVTAEGALPESPATNVPTITHDDILPGAPVVTDPSTTQMVATPSYTIVGTAEADAMVRIYNDLNDSGAFDLGEPVVASQQLTGGNVNFSINTPLATGDNTFIATATDAAGNESAAADVPTINTTAGGGGGGGGDDEEEGCSTGSRTGGWPLIAGMLAALVLALRGVRRRV